MIWKIIDVSVSIALIFALTADMIYRLDQKIEKKLDEKIRKIDSQNFGE